MKIFVALMLIFGFLGAQATTKATTATTTTTAKDATEKQAEKLNAKLPKDVAAATETHENVLEMQRDKRQLYDMSSYPIYYDGVQAVQPVTVISPTGVPPPATLANGGQQTPPGFLPAIGLNNQNLPIIGTLIGNLPALQNGQQNGGLLAGLPGGLGNGLNGLMTGLGNLGGLGGLGGLGALGGLGGLGNLGNIGGIGPVNPTVPTTPVASCPVTQKLTCRCESLIPIKPMGTRQKQKLEIVKQNVRRNEDGSRELRLVLSNGLILYQRSGRERLPNQQESEITQGYYALKYTDGRYFNIYYTINDFDYTIKSDVTQEPPKSDFDDETNTIL